jgi:DivIVA domain-containing protein
VNGDEVRAVRFHAGTHEAYEAAEVDHLLRRVAAELDAGRPVGPVIKDAQFRRKKIMFRTRSTEGYDVDAVDWFLDQLLIPGHSELAGIGADPWRDLDVARLIRSEVGGPGRRPARQAWLASEKHFGEECVNAWRDFGQAPGTHLRCGRVRRRSIELRAADGQTIASLRNRGRVQTVSTGGRSFTVKKIRPVRSSPPRFTEIVARSERDFNGHFAKNRRSPVLRNDPWTGPKWLVRELADETGTPILYASGRNFGLRAWAGITFPDQRWLRFLVRGTSSSDAIMTAVDQAGNKAVRYRFISNRSRAGGTVEITLHPD